MSGFKVWMRRKTWERRIAKWLPCYRCGRQVELTVPPSPELLGGRYVLMRIDPYTGISRPATEDELADKPLGLYEHGYRHGSICDKCAETPAA